MDVDFSEQIKAAQAALDKRSKGSRMARISRVSVNDEMSVILLNQIAIMQALERLSRVGQSLSDKVCIVCHIRPTKKNSNYCTTCHPTVWGKPI
jgi:hypothetical protein